MHMYKAVVKQQNIMYSKMSDDTVRMNIRAWKMHVCSSSVKHVYKMRTSNRLPLHDTP